MDIALCYPSVVPRRGGCESYVACLARHLAAAGHAVHLYACTADADALPGVHLHPVRLPPAPRFARAWLFSRACAHLRAGRGHDVSVGFDKIDGVDVYYPQGGEYPASVRLSQGKSRCRLARRVLGILRAFDPTHRALLALERRQLARPGAAVLAISRLVEGHLLSRGVPPAGPVRLLPIAAMPDRLGGGPSRHLRGQWGAGDADVVALFAGMNLRLKGVEPLLRALARLPESPLVAVVAGAEPGRAVRRLAGRLGVAARVRFVGRQGDMRPAYAAADLLVHPTFYDPCANVVLEALACGLPVVTTSRNGAAERMTPLGGAACAEGFVLDDPHDEAALARCLAELCDPERRRECGRAARTAAGRWTFAEHCRRLVEVLGEVRALTRPVSAVG